MQFENSHNDYAIKTRAIRTEKKLSTRKVNVAKSRRIIPALARRPEPYRGTMSPTLGLPTRQRHQQYIDCFARIFVFGGFFGDFARTIDSFTANVRNITYRQF